MMQLGTRKNGGGRSSGERVQMSFEQNYKFGDSTVQEAADGHRSLRREMGRHRDEGRAPFSTRFGAVEDAQYTT